MGLSDYSNKYLIIGSISDSEYISLRVRDCAESGLGVNHVERSIMPQSGLRLVRPCWVTYNPYNG